MKQLILIQGQLVASLLASYVLCTLSASPSDGFFETCERSFLSSNGVLRGDFTEGIFSYVMYDLVVNEGLKNDSYEDTKLRKKLLRSDGSPRKRYKDFLPPYADLPEPVMDVFANYSCSTFDGDWNRRIGRFCRSYLNGEANATDIPETSFIAVSDLTQRKASTVANEICNSVSNNWDALINNAIQFYLDEGLITSMSNTNSPSPSKESILNKKPTRKPSTSLPTPSKDSFSTSSTLPPTAAVTLSAVVDDDVPIPVPTATPTKSSIDTLSVTDDQPVPTATPTKSSIDTLSVTDDDVETSVPNPTPTERPIGISSIEGRTSSQTSQAVGGGDHVFIGLGAALFGLAIIAALAGFFVFKRKSNGARERELMSSPDNDMDGNLFIDDALLPPTHEESPEDKTFAVIPLKPSRSTLSKASQKSAVSSLAFAGNDISSVVSRGSAKSNKSSKSNESTKSNKSATSTGTERLLSHVRKALSLGANNETDVDCTSGPNDTIALTKVVSARTTVTAEMEDIEMILGLNSFESNQSRKSNQMATATTTPSFGETEEAQECSPDVQSSMKKNDKFRKVPSILKKKKAKNEAKISLAADEKLKKPPSKQDTKINKADVNLESEIPPVQSNCSDLLDEVEPCIMSLVSWGEKDESKGKGVEKWAAALDEASGKTYYYNEETQETTWVKPEGFVEEPAKKPTFSYHSKETLKKTDSTEGEWKVATDKFSGKPYYFNTLTLQTTWTKPEGFIDSDDGSDY